MFGAEMLLARSGDSLRKPMSDSFTTTNAERSFQDAKSNASIWDSNGNDNADSVISSISEIDLYISQNIPEEIRTPVKQALEASSSTPKLSSSNKKSDSWWERELSISSDMNEMDML